MNILGGRGAALAAVAESGASIKEQYRLHVCPPILLAAPSPLLVAGSRMHRAAHSTMSTPRTWTVTFVGVAQPDAFRRRLVQSPFYGRVEIPSVIIEGATLIFTFTSALDRNGVSKKCTQTFRAYGTYDHHAISEQLPPSTGSAASAGAEAAPPAPEQSLATRSSVEDIKALAAGLNRLEVHTLAVFFGLRYLEQTPAPQMQSVTRIRQAKAAASAVFLGPAAGWEAALAEHAARIVDTTLPCGCNCGCTVRSGGGLAMCFDCGRFCCVHCHPGGGKFLRDSVEPGPLAAYAAKKHGLDGPYFAYRCHACMRQPRLTTAPLPPPRRPDGLAWYFNFPEDSPWCTPNRDPSRDPQLLDILEVHKTKRLANHSRAVRPSGWEDAFVVDCLLGDAHGGSLRSPIRLGALVMNLQWKAHCVVSYLKDWLPANLGFLGPVLKPPPLLPVEQAPPSPRSPDAFVAESTVRIEDITDEAASEENNESMSPEEMAELSESLKRGRQEREAATEQLMESLMKRSRRD